MHKLWKDLLVITWQPPPSPSTGAHCECAARPCPFRNMDPTVQQIWVRLCGKSALPIKTQVHNRLGTNAQTAKEQIQKWFANKSTCDLRTMGSAGKQEELATRGLLATTNVSKHWNIGTVASLQWDPHSIETKEARCTILSSRNNKRTNDMEIERDQKWK